MLIVSHDLTPLFGHPQLILTFAFTVGLLALLECSFEFPAVAICLELAIVLGDGRVALFSVIIFIDRQGAYEGGSNCSMSKELHFLFKFDCE